MRTVLIALGVAVAIYALLVALFLLFGGRVLARELVRLIPNLVQLFRDLMRDARVPLVAKLMLGGAIVWIASPIDLLPEFLPVVGPLDDAIVAAFALRYLVKRAGADVISEHWRGDERTLTVLMRVSGVRP